MRIVYESDEEKSKFVEFVVSVLINMRRAYENADEKNKAEMYNALDKLDTVTVRGLSPKYFSEDEYKIIHKMLFVDKRIETDPDIDSDKADSIGIILSDTEVKALLDCINQPGLAHKEPSMRRICEQVQKKLDKFFPEEE